MPKVIAAGLFKFAPRKIYGAHSFTYQIAFIIWFWQSIS